MPKTMPSLPMPANSVPSAPALRLARPPAAADDALSPLHRRVMVAAILVAHGAAGWGLMQVREVRDAVALAAPMFVDLIAPPAPPPPLPAPLPLSAAPAPVVAADPPPAPALAAALANANPGPAEPPPVAPPAAPKQIPASAVQYLNRVLPVYSPASVRARESGRVVARVLIDEAGQPRTVQVQQSSQFVRLDDACAAAVRLSRFKPYTDNGQPTPGWALVPCDFEL